MPIATTTGSLAMKTIYLHIGNFKTGSSAIQSYCSNHRQQLLEKGVDYLATARVSSSPTSHGQLPLSLMQKYNASPPDWYAENISFDVVANSIRSAIDSSSADAILISSEEMYRFAALAPEKRDAISDELKNLLKEYRVKVLMYVRSPFEFAKSWYNELNKGRLPQHRFIDYFYCLNDALLLPQANTRFWRNSFGPDAVKLIPYKGDRAAHLPDFLYHIAISGHSVNPTSNTDKEINLKRDEASLERDRLATIVALCARDERVAYLRTSTLADPEQVIKLRKKIERTNRLFSEFCMAENLALGESAIALKDILVHEEYINRKDVLFINPLRVARIKLFNPEVVKRLKRLLSTFSLRRIS